MANKTLQSPSLYPRLITAVTDQEDSHKVAASPGALVNYVERLSRQEALLDSTNKKPSKPIASRNRSTMRAVDQIREHPIRFLKTVALYYALISLGLSVGMVGPTLLDLGLATNEPFKRINFVLPGRALGYTIGSIASKCHCEKFGSITDHDLCT